MTNGSASAPSRFTAATDANFKPRPPSRADPSAAALSAPSSRTRASSSPFDESTMRSSAYAAYLAARAMRESRSSAAMSPRSPTDATASASAVADCAGFVPPLDPFVPPLLRRSPVATLNASTANGSLPASAARFSASLSTHSVALTLRRTGGRPIRSGGRSLYRLPVGPLPPPLAPSGSIKPPIEPPVCVASFCSDSSSVTRVSPSSLSPSTPSPLVSCCSCPDGRCRAPSIPSRCRSRSLGTAISRVRNAACTVRPLTRRSHRRNRALKMRLRSPTLPSTRTWSPPGDHRVCTESADVTFLRYALTNATLFLSVASSATCRCVRCLPYDGESGSETRASALKMASRS